MKKFLFYFAVAGWTLSVAAHLMSLANIDVRDVIPYISLLQVGIFIVWIPVVLDLRRSEKLKGDLASNEGGNPGSTDPIKELFRRAPRWMAILAIAGIIYGVVNFALDFFSEQGEAAIRNGHYVLENHGNFIRNTTEQEYLHVKAAHVRFFSGGWIGFYGIAAAMLFPYSGVKDMAKG
jgi:hypothetical protein